MTKRSPLWRSAPARRALAAIGLLLLAACGAPPPATGINDPYEATNRRIHAFNKAVDRGLVDPGANAYGTVLPAPVRLTVSNFGNNLDMPRIVINDLLQGKVDDAVHNTFRLLVNTTFGLGGLLDPATDMGLAERDTDFGETLHVWGAGEGAYVELPLLGPSTERDAIGMVVDIGLNPLRYVLHTGERDAVIAVQLAARFGDRYRYSDTIDSVLYDSADSYAAARLLYLQNRRFKLGGDAGADYIDPYDDPYYDPYEDADVQ